MWNILERNVTPNLDTTSTGFAKELVRNEFRNVFEFRMIFTHF